VAGRDLVELSASFGSSVVAAAPNPSPAIGASGALVMSIPVVQQWLKFTDPQEHAFTVDMPKNWKDAGGTVRRNALQYRNWVSAISPDGKTVIAINDPNEWSYIAPSPMLAATGFRIGSLYNGGGGTTYTVAPYQSGENFAASWGQSRLASLCSSVQVTERRARPDIGQRVNVYSSAFGISRDFGEASFSCKRDGLEMTAYVFASVTSLGGTGIWYADTTAAFLAPSTVAGIAAGVLGHMTRSFAFDLAWLANGTQNAAAISRAAAETNAAISESIMKGWERRGAAIDRIMDEGSRVRLGIDIYGDPSTGDRYTVANSHNYYWVNARGNVVGTETDTAPVGYRRLNRVPPQ
jgi:hypothetical protein